MQLNSRSMHGNTGGRWAVCAWLLGSLFAVNILPHLPTVALVVSVVWIVALGVLRRGTRVLWPKIFQQSPFTLITAIMFLMASLASCSDSPHPITSLGYWFVTVVALLACGAVWQLAPHTQRAFESYAAIAILTLTALGGAFYEGGRFGVIRNPNSVGLIVFGIFTIGMMMPRPAWRATVMLLSGGILLLTGSRSALIATSIAAIVIGLHGCHVAKRNKHALALIGAGITIIATLWFHEERLATLANDYLALNDPYRGVGTGFSRRTDLWRETVALWRENPLLGVGYRAHEVFVQNESSSHNGYLALFAEVGILGALPLLLFICSGYYRLVKGALRGDRVAVLGLAITSGYLFIAAFERYLINFGNPTSLIVLSSLLFPGQPVRTNTIVRMWTPQLPAQVRCYTLARVSSTQHRTAL